jgi:hypothetical protein
MRLLQPSGAVRDGRSRLAVAMLGTGFEVNLARKFERMISYSLAKRCWSLRVELFLEGAAVVPSGEKAEALSSPCRRQQASAKGRWTST